MKIWLLTILLTLPFLDKFLHDQQIFGLQNEGKDEICLLSSPSIRIRETIASLFIPAKKKIYELGKGGIH